MNETPTYVDYRHITIRLSPGPLPRQFTLEVWEADKAAHIAMVDDYAPVLRAVADEMRCAFIAGLTDAEVAHLDVAVASYEITIAAADLMYGLGSDPAWSAVWCSS